MKLGVEYNTVEVAIEMVVMMMETAEQLWYSKPIHR
jgi:hypothetical protein